MLKLANILKVDDLATMTVKIERDRMVKVSELHQETAKWVEAAQEGPLFIMRYGNPKAALIGIEAFEELLDRLHLKAELAHRERSSGKQAKSTRWSASGLSTSADS